MQKYLDEFYRGIARNWKGSLVKVEYFEDTPNAKEYLNKLAKVGIIERVVWGWYWIPDKVETIWDFLTKDKNFKVISSQTAASLWNYDFVHRDVIILKVRDKSYGKALQSFAKKRGWKVKIEHTNRITFKKVQDLFVEDIEDTVIDCLQKWAFMDAFAALYVNRKELSLKKLLHRSYWKRISGTDVRIRQVLEYGTGKMNELSGKKLFAVKKLDLKDKFVKRNIDEAVERVVEIG